MNRISLLFWILIVLGHVSSALENTPTPSISPSATPRSTPVFAAEIDEQKWKKIADDGGVKTYEERESKEGVVAFRGETILPVSMMRIATVLQDESIRKEWVDSLKETRLIEKISDLDQVEYNHTKVPWPFQDRDFVYRANIKIDAQAKDRSMLIAMSSVQHELQPPKSGIVRGEVIYSYYYMKEISGPEPQTEVVVEMALDPKGAIPMWMVNLTQKRWPHNTLLALKKMALNPDLVVPKQIEDYFKGSQKPGDKK